jgi:hypothetical protein
MATELHGAHFLKNSKVAFESFKRFRTKNLDVDIYEIYYYAKKSI